jgi:very-short-patch-repair endonuclease
MNHLDPDIKSRMARAMRPSPDELALGRFLPSSFVHTGQNGLQGVCGYMPDYQDVATRRIVEYEGHYTHSTLQGLVRMAKRDAILARAGWDVLHIFPEDLRQPIVILEMVSAFVGVE